MVSLIHELLHRILRDTPDALREALRFATGIDLGSAPIRRAENDHTDLTPVEYRTDSTLLIGSSPEYGLILEAQLAVDRQKKGVWPVYATTAHKAYRCVFDVLVITQDPSVEAWAGEPIRFGTRSVMQPLVIGPSNLPTTFPPGVRETLPELGVFAFLVHGATEELTETGIRTLTGIGENGSRFEQDLASTYIDIVYDFASRALREFMENQKMNIENYQPRSPLAKWYVEKRQELERFEAALKADEAALKADEAALKADEAALKAAKAKVNAAKAKAKANAKAAEANAKAKAKAAEANAKAAMERATLETLRTAIESVIEKRGFTLERTHRDKLSACSDTTVLKRWLVQSVDADGPDDALS